MTVSEELFEAFCRGNGIQFEPITTGEQRTPDYMLYVEDTRVVVEVKQVDMNPDEREQHDILLAGDIAQGGGTPGDRARKKISDANQQLAKLTKGTLPSITVLYDNTPLSWHADDYNIRVAMYGLEVFAFAVASDPRIPHRVTDRKFGPKRKMAPTTNTSTSAVAAMFRNPDDPDRPPYLVLYHNVFAKIPLSPNISANMGVRQFTLEEAVKGKFQQWTEIIPANQRRHTTSESTRA